MNDYTEIDPFWVGERAKAIATKSTVADPSACGTCRSNAQADKPVEHDECQGRATLLQAPDHPSYELLAGFPLAENAALPARFHTPVFDDCGVPNAWLCAVCQEEGVVTLWPCATAVKHGTKVFTPPHVAETVQKKQAAELAAFRALDLGDPDGRVSASCDDPEHPTWLRKPDDVRGCPWCRIAEADLLPKADVVAWLTKKAREDTPVWQLASKADRGAIRPDNLRMLPPDFFEPGHSYTHRNGTDFQCVAVTAHPQTGERLAMGWHVDSWDLHYPTTVGINQWRHEYDGVQAPEASASEHYDKVPEPADGCHWCACGNRWPCKNAGEVSA